MLKYEMDEKAVRQQVTERGKREKKRKFLPPQSLITKLIKSSKVTKKERKKKGVTSSRFEIWYGQKPREKKKERKTRLKKKKREREREKEREVKLFSPIVKIRKDEKRKRKEFVKAWRRKGYERKVKWEKKKKWKKRRKNSELNCLFFSMIFLFLPLSSLKEGGVTWWLTETRRWEWYSPPVELKLSSSQKVTVRRMNVGHTDVRT